ncbi:MAG: glycosyltransferase family 9 protein [Candidatus Eremiobacteraeota bacterium]|nr:glycosyltransferase family 9 protein [Candidatus Eremiobacteraeota bacterium]
MNESRRTQHDGRPLLVALRALGLGDFLCGVPAYRALARAFSDHRRILAAPRALHPLIILLDGAFDDVVDVEPLGALPATLGAIDVAVNLHGSGPQSHRVLLHARPRRLIAFAHGDVAASVAGASWNPGEHEVPRWCRLLEHVGIAADATQLGIAVPDVALPAGVHQATVLHPGAASAARRWPPERWAAVARKLAARGDTVLVTGSHAERRLTERVVALARAGVTGKGGGGTVSTAGATSLLELANLVAHARCVISGDTGIGHLATAYGTPSVALFGPTPPSLWGPPNDPRHCVLWAGTASDPHAASPDPGLLRLSPGDVLAAAAELNDAVFSYQAASSAGGAAPVRMASKFSDEQAAEER